MAPFDGIFDIHNSFCYAFHHCYTKSILRLFSYAFSWSYFSTHFINDEYDDLLSFDHSLCKWSEKVTVIVQILLPFNWKFIGLLNYDWLETYHIMTIVCSSVRVLHSCLNFVPKSDRKIKSIWFLTVIRDLYSLLCANELSLRKIDAKDDQSKRIIIHTYEFIERVLVLIFFDFVCGIFFGIAWNWSLALLILPTFVSFFLQSFGFVIIFENLEDFLFSIVCTNWNFKWQF